jgi:hypothetical protein
MSKRAGELFCRSSRFPFHGAVIGWISFSTSAFGAASTRSLPCL